MRYNTESANGLLLPEGEYEAVVKKAEEKNSKAGNPMIELILTIYGPDGSQVDVFDYLLSGDTGQWKVMHFCESAGLDYAKGELLDEECANRNVRVRLLIDDSPKYGKKNSVKDYMLRSGAPAVPAGTDSDIPF